MVKNLPANAGDSGDEGSIPALGRCPEVGHGNPFQYSCLENSMDRVAWWAAVYGVTKSWTWLSNWVKTIFHVFFIHSSVNGYLGCCHVLAIISSAAMNSRVHVCFQIRVFIFSGYISCLLFLVIYLFIAHIFFELIFCHFLRKNLVLKHCLPSRKFFPCSLFFLPNSYTAFRIHSKITSLWPLLWPPRKMRVSLLCTLTAACTFLQ